MDESRKLNEKEKINAFNQIEERYFNRNFGTMSKTDYETLLFHIYIEHLLDSGLNFDDYTISKELGISQSKVRTLKVKKELQYPHDGFNWKKAFVEQIKDANYEDTSRRIQISIRDVNVMTELRYFMECNGWYSEYTLNPKIFRCRVDFFMELCSKLEQESQNLDEETEERLRELQKESTSQVEKSAIQEILEGTLEDGLKELALKAGKSVTYEVLKLVPFGGLAGEALAFLANVIKDS